MGPKSFPVRSWVSSRVPGLGTVRTYWVTGLARRTLALLGYEYIDQNSRFLAAVIWLSMRLQRRGSGGGGGVGDGEGVKRKDPL